jgi:hypothetical protein
MGIVDSSVWIDYLVGDATREDTLLGAMLGRPHGGSRRKPPRLAAHVTHLGQPTRLVLTTTLSSRTPSTLCVSSWW